MPLDLKKLIISHIEFVIIVLYAQHQVIIDSYIDPRCPIVYYQSFSSYLFIIK